MSVNFDRIASDYDATRGGDERASAAAAAVAAHLPADGPLLELGVGTGAVARRMPDSVVGVDISTAMLEVARTRVPGRLAQADAHALPFPSRTFAGAYAVWVFHLVADVEGVMREVARVLRRGAPFAIRPTAVHQPGELQAIIGPMYEEILRGRPWKDEPEQLAAAAARAGLELVTIDEVRSDFEQSPAEVADNIERRSGSAFWDISDDMWSTFVEPTIATLRAMPDPSRPRPSAMVEFVVVCARA